MQETTNNQTHPTKRSTKKKNNKRGLALIILAFIAIALLSKHESVTTIDCTPEIIARKPDIIMLGAWWCSYCYKAKKYFQKNKISYCEYDMENTEIGESLYKKHGGGAIPIILIGKYKLQGFNPKQIELGLTTVKNNK